MNTVLNICIIAVCGWIALMTLHGAAWGYWALGALTIAVLTALCWIAE